MGADFLPGLTQTMGTREGAGLNGRGRTPPGTWEQVGKGSSNHHHPSPILSRHLRRWRKATRPLPAGLQSPGSQEPWVQTLLAPVSEALGRALLLKALGGHLGPGAGGSCRPVTGLCPGRVVVTLNPQSSSAQWEAAAEKGEDLELSVESPCELREPEPSPFSSKRTMYETEEVRPGTRGSTEAPCWLWAVGQGLLGAPGNVT